MREPWFYHNGEHHRIDYELEKGRVVYIVPFIEHGLVQWISQYADVYTAVPTNEYFQVEFGIEQYNFVQYYKTANMDVSRLGRICEMCDMALYEEWHSPSFILHADQHYYFCTGQKKIVATGVSCKPSNEYRCVVFDYDRKGLDGNHWNNVQQITEDNQLASYIGSHDYVLDINLLKYGNNVLPGVVNFSKHQPAQYQPDKTAIGNKNISFINNRLEDNHLSLYVSDAFDSHIYDSSGFFDIRRIKPYVIEESQEIRNKEVKSVPDRWYFHTLESIDFDLANLLPYLREDINLYIAQDKSYYHWIDSDDYAERLSCPSSHK